MTLSQGSYFIFEPNCLAIAPMMTEPSTRLESIAEVVLLPCAPATENTRLPSSTIGRASLRDRHCSPLLRASTSSMLSGFIAAE